MRITVAAPAKINLWLRIGPPRPDGFHGLHTLFCGLDLADTLMVFGGSESDRAELELQHAPPLDTAPDLGPPADNLALRAARAFHERAGLEDRPRIRLIKRIPAGGGLGGGSSDAAAVLRALNRLHPRAVAPDDLMDIAADLGSDVPFFALGRPLALGAGRGERLRVLTPLPPRPVLVVLPGFPVSTADAFRWLDGARGVGGADTASDGGGRVPAEPGELPEPTWEGVRDRAANDFEAVVFERHPRLAEIRDGLRDLGAAPALLAGSGSSLFGVFDTPEAAAAAETGLRERWPELRVVRTSTRAR